VSRERHQSYIYACVFVCMHAAILAHTLKCTITLVFDNNISAHSGQLRRFCEKEALEKAATPLVKRSLQQVAYFLLACLSCLCMGVYVSFMYMLCIGKKRPHHWSSDHYNRYLILCLPAFLVCVCAYMYHLCICYAWEKAATPLVKRSLQQVPYSLLACLSCACMCVYVSHMYILCIHVSRVSEGPPRHCAYHQYNS
jgi:hypothetical protein